MKAALRVLTALNERQEPNPSDVDELHWYAPADRQRPLDEVVCDAIQHAMSDRDLKRKAIKTEMRARALALKSMENETPPSANPGGDRQDYQELTAKLKRLGIALQQAADVIAAAGEGHTTSSQTATDMLESVAGDVDISGITELLKEHARLARNLSPDEQALKKHSTKQ